MCVADDQPVLCASCHRSNALPGNSVMILLDPAGRVEIFMAGIKTRFSRKLHLAFGTMLIITLALAWYFYDSVQWFEHDVERITIANSVLNDYRTVSALGARKLSLIEESTDKSEISDLPHWHDIDRRLRAAISAIRQSLAEESALQNVNQNIDGLANLDELEGLIESIIGSGEFIKLALETQQTGAAQAESERLYNEGTAEIFNVLMGEILAARAKELGDANTETISLAHYITGVLPLFMLALAGFTALIIWLFSRSLTRSVNVLYHGAKTFTGGDLNHRIPELQEKEFGRLGEAFNIMARELADHRVSMHDSNVRLEAVVEERTRALKSSNDMLAMVDENRRELLADISHEFRTPLTVIRGEAEIAMRGKTKTPAEYHKTLERIVDQTDQTTRLVDDLLFIARADAGEPRLKIRPVSVGSLLDVVCADFTATAEQQQINILHEPANDTAVVMGDDGRLRQVFSILIDNALRYSNAGGKVEVRLKRQDQKIIVTVRDSGIGLTIEEARQAFQRFFRGGQAQGHARGTGLGLPVAKAIVEAHKGSITLEGKPGEGAWATVVLPAEDKLKAVA
jgi:two-component system OmpR family sensor kinase